MKKNIYIPIKFDYVDIINKQLLSMVRDHNPNLTRIKMFNLKILKDYSPLLVEQLDALNLTIDIVKEFVTPPLSEFSIHRDGSVKYPKLFALNWPIENCKNTYMKWWEFDGDPIIERIEYDNYDVALPIYSKINATEIGCLELIHPTIVNVQCYHSVDNNVETYRRLISFRFNPEPLHLID
jgi:hypothetical protein